MDATRLERVWVKKLRDATLDAIKGGSPDKDLDELVKWLDDIKIWKASDFFSSFLFGTLGMIACTLGGRWMDLKTRERERGGGNESRMW